MYRIITAEHSGFCFGVKRAINMIEEVSNRYSGEDIYTLGPIIHNPQTVERMKKKGVKVLNTAEEISSIESGVVILRTHGIEKHILDMLEKKDVTLIDATCPFVRKAQDYVVHLNNEGFPIIIIGEPNHPEVKALKSQIAEKVLVIAGKDDVVKIKNLESGRVGIVSQTTQNYEDFKSTINVLCDYFKELHIYNTICNATSLRQQAAVSLAKRADMMLIIGGYNSANTKRLYNLCRRIQERTYHIETIGNIEDSWFEDGIETIGIAAGASTPDWIIEDVKNYLKDK
ncbi:MAG: 4-hydroxy-3-methylbut-2-enyl diphosphate reductase [candidate division WOR-3 bacterium]|nr:4-hydroxy-3-methylbut-2-enyl diphosphate reductase [candidate division WOR-3 bacterium]